MATYDELASMQDDVRWNGFKNRIRVAATIKAASIIESTTPGATALEWAKAAIANPVKAGDDLIWFVIATNNTVSIDQIFTAGNTAVQNNVNAAVDAIYGT